LVPESRRLELMAEYLRSGLTRVEFARRAGVKYTTLCNWVQHARGKPLVNFTEAALVRALRV
jgi:transposase-like protein